MMPTIDKDEAVAREIAGLADLSRDDLVRQWRTCYGRPPPKKLSRAMIEKALAYQIQCRAFGGLKAATRRALRAALAGTPSAPARAIAPGARLVREWNGVTHEVEVVEAGFRWQGRTWRSLSAIAREITGATWSGPRFFGLTGRR